MACGRICFDQQCSVNFADVRQCEVQVLQTSSFKLNTIDRVIALGTHGNNPRRGRVCCRFGISAWQTDIHFIEFGPAGGQHQKNENNQQHINEWNQVDVGLGAVALSEFQD